MDTLQYFQYEMITQNNFMIITNYYEINNSRNSNKVINFTIGSSCMYQWFLNQQNNTHTHI